VKIEPTLDAHGERSYMATQTYRGKVLMTYMPTRQEAEREMGFQFARIDSEFEDLRSVSNASRG